MSVRKIIHVDMDAFFASVEQRDFPEYQGKPVIVGGSPERRGVVAACSYEARKFGIHSAMASATAYRLCPAAVFLPPRFEAYRNCSQQIHAIFREFTKLIEPLSLDEAFLDVSNSEHCQGSATLIAKEIKKRIKQELNLTASAGVSYNKFLAKIASDMDKPDGLYVIKPEQAQGFIEKLPVRKFFGIGKATEKKMHALDIHTGADLKALSILELQTHFGKFGEFYYNIVRGIDERPVRSSRKRKSIGKETTFAEDISDTTFIWDVLKKIAERIQGILADKDMEARTVTLKVKYHDFQQITRSITVDKPVTTAVHFLKHIPELIEKTEIGERPIRLIGITLSSLSGKGEKKVEIEKQNEQLGLFENE